MTTPIHPQTLLDIIRKAEESVNARSEPVKRRLSDKTMAFVKKLARSLPNNPAAYHLLGVALEKQGRLDEALSYFRRAVKINPNCPTPYCILGGALDRMGKKEEAEAAYRKAVELDPSGAIMNADTGLALLITGKRGEAMRYYQKSADAGNKFAKGFVAYMKKHKPKRRT